MSEYAIEIENLGRMYKLYKNPTDKMLDAFGLNFWKKNYYQEFWALRGLNLKIKKGERIGLIGYNGAGKSTLLKTVIGNIPPTEGKVVVNGKIQALMELGTGFHPEFSGRENIRASLAYQGLSSKEIADKEEEIIDFAELEDFIDQPVKTYSAGMYARLAFSTATAIEPDILIIDEILGAGDAYFAGKSVERMRRLTDDSGATVLFVSHDLGSVQQLCDRVIWIDRGRVVADGLPLEVTKMYYAATLKREEHRIKAKNTKIAKRYGNVTDINANESKEVLFRFVTSNGLPPKQLHAIKKILLTNRKGFNLTIEPGSPMDNDGDQSAYILADPKYMVWSVPKKIEGDFVRCIEDTGGKYGHAPFTFIVPEGIWNDDELEIVVDHFSPGNEGINLEMFDEDGYKTIGALTSGKQYKSDSFLIQKNHNKDASSKITDDVSSLIQRDEKLTDSAEELKSQDKWATGDAEFKSVITTDDDGNEKQIFSVGESINFKINVNIKNILPKCWIDMVVYDEKGNRVSLIVHRLEGAISPGNKVINIKLKKPNLRQGEYVMSLELLKHYDDTAVEKLPYYCHWNRCIVFRIDEGYVGNIPLGSIKLDYVVGVS